MKFFFFIPARVRGFIGRHKILTTFALLLLLGVVGIALAVTRPKKPEYVTALAERGDLLQTVEAVGTVISERDLELQFPRSGVVQDVFVREGDHVTAGQRLATLRAGSLSADIASASAQLQSAEAELRSLEEGTRPEDILISEAEVENKRASLAAARTTLANAKESLRTSEEKLRALRSEAAVSLAGQVSLLVSTVGNEIAIAESSLTELESVWNDPDVLDAIIKSRPDQYELIRRQIAPSRDALSAARAGSSVVTGYEDVLLQAEEARRAITLASDLVRRAFDVVNALVTSGYFTESEKNEHTTTLSSERSTMETAIRDLENGVKTLRDAGANFETRIAAEEAALSSAEGTRDKASSDILSFESSVRIGEAQLAFKRAGARPADLDAARARVKQQRAAVARAAAEYAETVITAPIDGTITNVAVKAGELAPVGAAITLLGTTPMRIEMFVSEIDIPKVIQSQSGSIELDAFRDVHMKLRVSEIDPAATDKDGVSKYRVKLDFVHRHDELKVGMTGDAEIVTGFRSNVLFVPLRSVLEDQGGKEFVRVLREDGMVEERYVQTGMEGADGNVEMKTGIREGETIVVLEKEA